MKLRLLSSTLSILVLSGLSAQAVLVWQMGDPGRGWPIDGVGGGPDVDFFQENGVVTPAPGSATTPAGNGMGDNDYYFAGSYGGVIGVVPADETVFERAYAGGDTSLRVHNNLIGVAPTDLVSVSFEANNLHIDALSHTDPRWGVEIYVNGNLLMPEQIIRPADLNTVHFSPVASAASLGVTPGSDNIVELRGISYNGDNGGNWMGMDYYALDATPIPEPSAPMFVLAAAGMAFLRRRR